MPSNTSHAHEHSLDQVMHYKPTCSPLAPHLPMWQVGSKWAHLQKSKWELLVGSKWGASGPLVQNSALAWWCTCGNARHLARFIRAVCVVFMASAWVFVFNGVS